MRIALGIAALVIAAVGALLTAGGSHDDQVHQQTCDAYYADYHETAPGC